MDAAQVYAQLQAACRALEDAGHYAIAAHVSHAMALVKREYGVGQDHLECEDD